MKKYLNKNIFYQGDSKIYLPLLLIYFINYVINSILIRSFFKNELIYKLYYVPRNYYSEFNLIYKIDNWVLMVAYYVFCYLIIVGFFKRKKWSTLLCGPFSRLDIRKRELILVLISFLVYILTFMIIVGQNIYLNKEMVIIIDGFYKFLLLDILRIVSISFIGISIVAILDSFFSNAYYFIASIILLIVYVILLVSNFNNIIYSFLYSNRLVFKFIDVIRGYLVGNFIEVKNEERIIVIISVILILLSILFIKFAKRLTEKMLVENMNEGIIFELPKKFMKFIISTFLGLVFSPSITNYLNEFYFNYNLLPKDLIGLNIIIILILSLISFIIIKKMENNKKKEY